MAAAAITPSTHTWQEANQLALVAALAEVRAHLICHAARARQAAVAEAQERLKDSCQRYRQTLTSMPSVPAVELVRGLFDLSPFERSVVLLCAGLELDASFGEACAEAQGDTQSAWASFGLALAAMPEAHWSALEPHRPLRRWRLIEFASQSGQASAPLTTRPLRIDERILHFLTGSTQIDDRLSGTVERA